MKYDMLPYKTVERVWDTFQDHSCCINEKYASFKGKDNYWYSDRDRFVGRFFKKYIGKYIAFIDRELIGYSMDNYFFPSAPQSVYSNEYHKSWGCNRGEPVIRVQKKYLAITRFTAINEMYGLGYIEMSCVDAMGYDIRIRVDHNNMLRFQFREISESEMESVVRLFKDDRDDRPFKVTRYLTYEEIKERKVKGKKVKKTEERLVQEEVVVMAKDIDEAAKVLPNTINVERAQDG